MGVPAFFRWISNKYPKIISPVVDDGSAYEAPNVNGELDNLYLDMNGIVHPCSHPENKPPPENESQMMLEVFKYTDRVIRLAKPRKILMIAVDGVAPRAKMNQQRSRRFRSARDARVKKAEIEVEQNLQRQKDLLNGKLIDDSIASNSAKQWDSNSITPGTPFMDILAQSLRYWVAYKLSNDEGWADLQVVLSDSSVPGEGEHKIMNFVRSQRLNPEYNPNTTHAIYGLDADLIFLSLATHEPHFRVLREDVFAKFSGDNNNGFNRKISVRDQMEMSQQEKQDLNEKDSQKQFLWLNSHILREYLKVELMSNVDIPQLHKNLDFERCLDDWVFLCFFIGNDFLPSIPSLNVKDDNINLLVQLWKKNLPYLFNNKQKFNNNYYLTKDGHLNLPAVESLLKSIGLKEDYILKNKHSQEVRRAEMNKKRQEMRAQNKDKLYKGSNLNEHKIFANNQDAINSAVPLYSLDDNKKSVNNVDKSSEEIISNPVLVNKSGTVDEANQNSFSAAAAIKAQLLKKRSLDFDSNDDETPSKVAKLEEEAETPDSFASSDDISATDDDYMQSLMENAIVNTQTGQMINNNEIIRIWEPGYSDRYYKLKFNLTDEDVLPFKKKLLVHYLEGLSWVLLYYYQGCPSWNWYYPYHYAPFAKDFEVLDFAKDVKIEFDIGEPFKPFEQLMSVLPADSSHNLPEVFHSLMKDPGSDIIEYYPEYFDIDMNGSHLSWHGIPLLPFINEQKLLENVQAKYKHLTSDEERRNQNKTEYLYISKKNKLYKKLKKSTSESTKEIFFNAKLTNLSGIAYKAVEYENDDDIYFPLKENDPFNPYPSNISSEVFLVVGYDYMKSVEQYENKSMILNRYVNPIPVLNIEDKNAILYGGQGFAVRQKKNFTHQQNENINFALTVGPPKVRSADGKLKSSTKQYGIPMQGTYSSFLRDSSTQHSFSNIGGLANSGNMNISMNNGYHNNKYNNSGNGFNNYNNTSGFNNSNYNNAGFSNNNYNNYNGFNNGNNNGFSGNGYNNSFTNNGYSNRNNYNGFNGRGRGRGRGNYGGRGDYGGRGGYRGRGGYGGRGGF